MRNEKMIHAFSRKPGSSDRVFPLALISRKIYGTAPERSLGRSASERQSDCNRITIFMNGKRGRDYMNIYRDRDRYMDEITAAGGNGTLCQP